MGHVLLWRGLIAVFGQGGGHWVQFGSENRRGRAKLDHISVSRGADMECHQYPVYYWLIVLGFMGGAFVVVAALATVLMARVRQLETQPTLQISPIPPQQK